MRKDTSYIGMSSIINFKINDFVSLKLENNETVIYVKENKFSICKHLVLNIPIDKISSFNEIQSIDEASDRITRQRIVIPPETEFWGHCSVRHEAVWLNTGT